MALFSEWNGDRALLLLVSHVEVDGVARLIKGDAIASRMGLNVVRYSEDRDIETATVPEYTVVIVDSVPLAERHHTTVNEWLVQPHVWVIIISLHMQPTGIQYDIYRLRSAVNPFEWSNIVMTHSQPTESEVQAFHNPDKTCHGEITTRKYGNLASRIAMNSDASHVVWCHSEQAANVIKALKELISEDVLNDGRVRVVHGTHVKVTAKCDIIHMATIPDTMEQWEYILQFMAYRYDRWVTSVRLYIVDIIEAVPLHNFETILRKRHRYMRRAYGKAMIIDFAPLVDSEDGGYVLRI